MTDLPSRNPTGQRLTAPEPTGIVIQVTGEAKGARMTLDELAAFVGQALRNGVPGTAELEVATKGISSVRLRKITTVAGR